MHAAFTDTKAGASYFFQGLGMLARPRVLPFIIAPLIVNSAIYYFGFTFVFDYFSQSLQLWVSTLPNFLSFLAPVLKALFLALLIIIAALTFSSLATIIGAPLYGFLAEQVVFLKTGSAPNQPLTLANLLKIMPRTMARELRKLLYYLSRAIPLGILSLLCFFILTPLQPVMAFIWLLFGSRMLSIQYTDYAFDNDGLNFQTMRKSLKSNRALSLSFGATAQAALMIPILPIVFVPAAVCGATLLYCEKLAQN